MNVMKRKLNEKDVPPGSASAPRTHYISISFFVNHRFQSQNHTTNTKARPKSPVSSTKKSINRGEAVNFHLQAHYIRYFVYIIAE